MISGRSNDKRTPLLSSAAVSAFDFCREGALREADDIENEADGTQCEIICQSLGLTKLYCDVDMEIRHS